MKNTFLKQFKNIWVIAILIGCTEPYTPPEIENNPNILVVDGFLDGTKRECIVSLARTQRLGSNEQPNDETGAVVSLQENGGNSIALIDHNNGKYSLSNIAVSVQKEYKIHVKTKDGMEYTSDYVVLKASPPIDSVTWEATDQGIQIQATTHDPLNIARYYQWIFVETWQYTSAYYSNMKFQNGSAVLRDDDIYTCWQQVPSTNIIVSSSDKLTQDVIYKNPITLLTKTTDKYLMRYSILVQQRVLSKEGYNFWSELQKNTENLGTLFDPQPSQILGNIYDLQNAKNPVLGYFSASYTSEKRIFINNADLPQGYLPIKTFAGCRQDTVLLVDLPKFGNSSNLLTQRIVMGGIILIGYGSSSVDCVDCRAKGGTNVQPDFW